MSPALIEALLEVARHARDAGHGGKEAVYADACRHLGLSRATLLRHLKAATVQAPRKRRADAGQVSLSRTDAQLLSAALMEGYRANDKAIHSLKLALQRLRANRPGFACVVDAQTGELLPLSDSACARALRTYSLHPEQLRQPAPVTQLASDHPNDVWQIDASISTLFYVPESGLADMSPAVFYKNKPGNFEKIKRQRLTRYVVTDHCSGAIFVHYVAGGESIVNMTDSFLCAIRQRVNQQLYGVPFRLMMDPGAGTAVDGGAIRSLLARLLVEPVINSVGNARAKGQVENAHNIVECDFESGFKFGHVPGIDWINQQAARWMRWYNSVKVHSRHGLTRYQKWLEITPEQLRVIDPALDVRALVFGKAITRQVTGSLTVEFKNAEWKVGHVPGVMIGEAMTLAQNPFNPDSLFAVTFEDGHEVMVELPRVELDQHGFPADAPRIGREFKGQPDTVLETNRKQIERLATGAATDEAAAAARKAKALPFGSRIDAYKHLDNVPDVATLPRRGTALDVSTRTAAAPERALTLFEAAAELARRGVAMDADKNRLVAQWHPDGVPESALDDLQARLTVRSGLRVVGAGS